MFELRKVFTNPAGDKDFGKKFIIGSLVMIFPVVFSIIQEFLTKEHTKAILMQYTPAVLAASVLAGFFALVSMGYYFQIINNRINSSEETLPAWKIWKYFTIGLKAFIGIVLLIIPLSLILVAVVAVCMVLPFISPIGPILSIFAAVIYLILLILLALIMNLSFAYDFNILSYFNFCRAGEILKGKVFKFLMYIGLIGAVSILIQMFSFLVFLCVGIISLIILIPLAFYALLLNAELAGQFLSKDVTKEEIGE